MPTPNQFGHVMLLFVYWFSILQFVSYLQSRCGLMALGGEPLATPERQAVTLSDMDAMAAGDVDADAPGMGALKRRHVAAPFPCRLTRPPPARIDLTDFTEARAAASTRRPAAAKATARAKAAGKGAAKARRNPDLHSRSKLQHLESGV